jgi:arsenate reductase
MSFMNDRNSKKSVLFICKNNSGRSQMAEGLFKQFYGDKFNVYSGGIDPKTLNPLTIEVMAEIGVDISDYSSTHLREYQGQEFDYVVTLCHDENCTLSLNGENLIHYEFNDPATYNNGNMENIEIFRIIRDEIREWIENSLSKKIR